MEEEKEKVN